MENKEKIIIANWKMKLGLAESAALAKKMKTKLKALTGVETVLCPNFVSLTQVKEIIQDSNLKLGAQDVFWEDKGSYTGEVSAGNLAEAGCQYVIVGHS